MVCTSCVRQLLKMESSDTVPVLVFPLQLLPAVLIVVGQLNLKSTPSNAILFLRTLPEIVNFRGYDILRRHHHNDAVRQKNGIASSAPEYNSAGSGEGANNKKASNLFANHRPLGDSSPTVLFCIAFRPR